MKREKKANKKEKQLIEMTFLAFFTMDTSLT